MVDLRVPGPILAMVIGLGSHGIPDRMIRIHTNFMDIIFMETKFVEQNLKILCQIGGGQVGENVWGGKTCEGKSNSPNMGKNSLPEFLRKTYEVHFRSTLSYGIYCIIYDCLLLGRNMSKYVTDCSTYVPAHNECNLPSGKA